MASTKDELGEKWMKAESDFDVALVTALEAKREYERLADEAGKLKDLARAAHERWKQAEK